MVRLHTSTGQRHDGDASSSRNRCAEARPACGLMVEGYRVHLVRSKRGGRLRRLKVALIPGLSSVIYLLSYKCQGVAVLVTSGFPWTLRASVVSHMLLMMPGSDNICPAWMTC